ncbi:MAG TPA: FkbM family methyltransferase, partial [Kofleriaceae bacterium]|nr:FkbM family methyltransferase [Kofleriaceae bacterium]
SCDSQPCRLQFAAWLCSILVQSVAKTLGVRLHDARRMAHEALHHFLRRILSKYPIRFGAAAINRILDGAFGGSDANWLVAPSRGYFPTMVLDVSTNLQRKLFYFPRVYGRFYGTNTFAKFIRGRLKPGDTFYDIGANVGFFSLLAAGIVGDSGSVYAFEPEPVTCDSIAKSAKVNGYSRLHAVQCALSDHEGEADFYCARDGTANSLVTEAPGREKRYERKVTTRVTRLDNLVAEGTIDPRGLSLIKVDVEGAEARTVRGMRESLVAADYPAIWCEVRGPKGSTRAPNTYPAVLSVLKDMGYTPVIWSEQGRRHVRDEDVVGRADVLFERSR